MLMKTYRIFISSDSRIQSSTLVNAMIPLNVSLFPKFKNPELRIETLNIESGLITAPRLINIAMPNIVQRNMQAFSTTPVPSSIVKTFNSITYDEENSLNAVGIPIDGVSLMNSGFVQVQILNDVGVAYAVADANKKWNMTLVIMDRESDD